MSWQYLCDCGTAVLARNIERSLGSVTVMPGAVVCNECGNQMIRVEGGDDPPPNPPAGVPRKVPGQVQAGDLKRVG